MSGIRSQAPVRLEPPDLERLFDGLDQLAAGISDDLERMVDEGMFELDPAMLALLGDWDHEPNV